MHGIGRGGQLGFPTANIRLAPGSERPADGVYACWVKLDGDKRHYRGALHSGPRPTFAEAQPTVEIHLLHFPPRELYGRNVRFRCVKYLRAVLTFAAVADLAAAMAHDCQEALVVLR